PMRSLSVPRVLIEEMQAIRFLTLLCLAIRKISPKEQDPKKFQARWGSVYHGYLFTKTPIQSNTKNFNQRIFGEKKVSIRMKTKLFLSQYLTSVVAGHGNFRSIIWHSLV
ncbi:hypothetical protein L9F63_007220, partial [Diploptera punctata]